MELMREETVKTLSFSSRIRSFEAKPQTCVFLPNEKRSGVTPRPWNAHIVPGQAHAGLHLVEDEQHVVLVAERTHAGEELGTEMVVAAFPLDRLEDERGDVVAVLVNRPLDLRDREVLEGDRRREALRSDGEA